ncbi:aspartate aminotransferase family protein [Ruminiclostridium cellulolyticum]|uniref:Aminotransferase class-III n=1 Tax=Ruminiclostridium cellulolyticum (strain ATCC 35319 / DSM 5812 / JCM 6584 / H10) TaxID=394503 RepID=B8I0Z2_RUMCH|nr:aminotransferase class III-fold pyridoxal phosphate-dependent enzyme [Ruminiclostridium cellulolyticum]ACL77548.1 aminotransferase class-III [Ruminiclostridium cellulolyticum H10]
MGSTYWRPFNRADGENVINIVKGEGIFLYDDSGRRFQDAYSGLWNMNYGYSDNDIKKAIKTQIEELPYINPITLGNPKASELADKLCSITHDEITKVLFTCSGSEAIEAAIKISRKYNNLIGKKQYHIAVISESYHGSYYGSMSASFYDENEKQGYGPMVDGFIKLVLPFSRRCKTEEMTIDEKNKVMQKLEETLQNNKDKLCAIIVEPILASGGVIPLFEEYLSRINSFCRENNVLFVCDEVATGFGRTGTMFRFQKFDLKPDIITMSKGINNGYLPLGAVCISEKIESAFLKENQILFHLSTQNANPICLAAALATIDKMERDNILEVVNAKSTYFKKILNDDLSNLSMVFEIRIHGLMAAIDLADRETNNPISHEQLIKVISTIYSLGCFAGISYTKDITSSILIFPQYIATESDLDNIVKIVKTAISNSSGI